jgi:muramoyltetrapeptide carboxypeptidase
MRPWKRIGVPAPSWRGRTEEVLRGVRILETEFDVRLGSVAASRPNYNSPFNRLEERAEELVGMLRDDSIDAVWCLDGGAGASYLLPILKQEYEREPWPAKPVIGWSDITFLLMYLVKLGHKCFVAKHVACENEEHDVSVRNAVVQLQRILGSSYYHVDYPIETLRDGEAEGLCLGGTISVLTNMMGTEYCPSFDGSLVFFEEHGTNAPGEREYLLWDKIQGIQLGGYWKNVAGFVVGEVEIGGPYETDEDLFPTLWEVLERTLNPLTAGPVVTGFPFGVSRKSCVVPIGVPAKMYVSNSSCDIEWWLDR